MLTVAHCLGGIDPDALVLVAGEHNLRVDEGTEQRVPAKEVISAPIYDTSLVNLAIVKTLWDFRLDGAVSPVALPDNDHISPTGSAVVSGWGITHPQNKNSYSPVLQSAAVDIYPDQSNMIENLILIEK